VAGFTLNVARRDPEFAARGPRELFDGIAAGAIQVIIGDTCPLAEAAAAQSALEGRRSVGKLLLIVDEAAAAA